MPGQRRARLDLAPVEQIRRQLDDVGVGPVVLAQLYPAGVSRLVRQVDALEQTGAEAPLPGQIAVDLGRQLHLVAGQDEPRALRGQGQAGQGLALEGLGRLVDDDVGRLEVEGRQAAGGREGRDDEAALGQILARRVPETAVLVRGTVVADYRVDLYRRR